MSSRLNVNTNPVSSSSSSLQGTPRSSNSRSDNNLHMSTRSEESSVASTATTTTGRNNSSNQRTLNFFKSIVGQKHSDYHSDAPQQPLASPAAAASPLSASPPPAAVGSVSNTATPSRGPSTRSFGSRGTFPSMRAMLPDRSGNQQPGGGYCRGCCSNSSSCCTSPFCWPADKRRLFTSRIINSPWWKITLILFTIVLLFGAQIRDLWLPAGADDAMDCLFLVALAIFTLDICIRIDVEPNYFCFSLFCWQPRATRQESQLQRDSMPSGWTGCASCRLGSFLFWCDVVSTLTLLYEISFINTSNFDEQAIYIVLNSFGIPIDGLEGVNEATPVQVGELDLLVTIAKSARVARFIRSSTAVKISSKVNWYWLLNLFNPCYWWIKCCSNQGPDVAKPKGDVTSNRSVQRSSSTELNVKTDVLMRRSSWGGIGLGALAAVKAKAKAQEDETSGGFSRKLKKAPSRAMQFFGFAGKDEEEWRRHMAATKIQRAWRRAHRAARPADDDGYQHSEQSHGDPAWRGRTSAHNPMDRAFQKRSFLMNYGKMNIRSIARFSRSKTDDETNGAGSMQPQKRNESQVGSAMRELTGQRVAIGIIIALILTVLFTYTEENATRPSTMIVLFNQTGNAEYANKSLDAARTSSVPDLFEYTLADNETRSFELDNGENPDSLRARETLRITVTGADMSSTIGVFALRNEKKEEATVNLLSTIFILLIWFFGVTAFAGPVMILVVIPIERMVRLLGMLMVDPLGYQSTSRYKRFVAEEDEITKNTRWSKEVLKGMETSFLMSTILRIGSLMKVGFGSAGVEIIRKNLEKGQSKNMLILNSQGSTVSCIFLFCDIRQFTDATECLQEEVFVFTNRIAAVVHSICHAYGGSANKNIGDAFLLSWQLDEYSSNSNGSRRPSGIVADSFTAKTNQADKALLSVVKICKALYHDDYYLDPMSDGARSALLTKLKGRKGPVVQLGFGLHAGKAVQGAIGSQRKIDATYVSEAVERAEFLESSTKKYGLKMLMSDSFHRLLHPSNRRRCRKVDQILIRNDEDDEDEDPLNGDIMELLTFDMDIDALWKNVGKSDTGHESDSESGNNDNKTGSKRMSIPMTSNTRQLSGGRIKTSRRLSTRMGLKDQGSDELSDAGILPGTHSQADMETETKKPEFSLPTGPALYNANVWAEPDMRRIRELYSDGLFFQKFHSGLQSFYARDWEHAKQCFVSILERFEDGPSRYFLTQIETNNGKPPRDFLGYGTA